MLALVFQRRLKGPSLPTTILSSDVLTARFMPLKNGPYIVLNYVVSLLTLGSDYISPSRKISYNL